MALSQAEKQARYRVRLRERQAAELASMQEALDRAQAEVERREAELVTLRLRYIEKFGTESLCTLQESLFIEREMREAGVPTVG